MRLNPLGLEFLGLLPTQDLVLFNRRIFPLVCRIKWQRRFFPNWEVAKIVPIPLRHLLDADRYAQYRLTIDIPNPRRVAPETKTMPCFLHRYPQARIVGEEAAADDPAVIERLGEADLAFVIDPVDGTYNFASGMPTFGTILAVVVKGDQRRFIGS